MWAISGEAEDNFVPNCGVALTHTAGRVVAGLSGAWLVGERLMVFM